MERFYGPLDKAAFEKPPVPRAGAAAIRQHQ